MPTKKKLEQIILAIKDQCELKQEKIDLVPAINLKINCQEMIQYHLSILKKSCLLEFICPSQLKINSSQYQLITQTFHHLIKNSIDHGFSHGKGNLIKIKLSHLDEHFFKITFKDNGFGMDQKTLEHIFDEGYSTKNEVTDISGRGIGLSTVKHSLLSINSTIEVHSNAKYGTRFEMVIPIENNNVAGLGKVIKIAA